MFCLHTNDDDFINFCVLNSIFIFFHFSLFLNCILGFGVHVKNMQDCCIGTHVVVWFAAFLPFTCIWHFSPCYLSPTPHPLVSLLCSPQHTPVCSAPLLVSMCSHCSTPAYEWQHAVSHFLFLCQFAENDALQVHPCPNKGHELIVFEGCITFHGIYVPHFPCPVYLDGHLGWFQVFAIVNTAAMNICVHVSL